MSLILPPSAPGWDCSASTTQMLICTYPALGMNASAPPIVVSANVSGSAVVLLNQATASTPGDLNPTNNTDTAECQAAAVPAPTLSPWGLGGALLMLAAIAGIALRRLQRMPSR
jgi:hypothetical protein